MQLEHNHFRAIELLISGRSQEQIAEILDITTKTLNNWRKDSEFNYFLRKSYATVHEDNLLKLAASCREIDQQLLDIATSEETPLRYKLQAMNAYYSRLELLLKQGLEARIERLEERAGLNLTEVLN